MIEVRGVCVLLGLIALIDSMDSIDLIPSIDCLLAGYSEGFYTRFPAPVADQFGRIASRNSFDNRQLISYPLCHD